jgi:hypothetical protein
MKCALHGYNDLYDCGNEECPISFNEEVLYSTGMYVERIDDGRGTLLGFSFNLDGIPCRVYYGHAGQRSIPQFLIHARYNHLNCVGAEVIIEEPVVIDWSDLSDLSRKIKTWLTFS